MKILIVEDAPNIRTNLKKFFSELKELNISGEAEDSESAISLINKTKPDIIILDVELKKGSGFDVLKYVKGDKYASNSIVIMFSNHTKLYKEKAKAAKADYFFDKTDEVDKLLSTIHELCM